MTPEDMERKIDALQGEVDAACSLLNFFIDATARYGPPELVNALRLHITNMLSAARGEMARGETTADRFEGFEIRHGFFHRKITNFERGDG